MSKVIIFYLYTCQVVTSFFSHTHKQTHIYAFIIDWSLIRILGTEKFSKYLYLWSRSIYITRFAFQVPCFEIRSNWFCTFICPSKTRWVVNLVTIQRHLMALEFFSFAAAVIQCESIVECLFISAFAPRKSEILHLLNFFRWSFNDP